MATKLFVGALSYNINDDQLKELFSACGTVVSASVISDRDTNRSKGFAFVEMSTDDEAQEAIKQLNGKEVDGRTIVVNIAKPKEDRPARPSYGPNRRY
jgi:RNA recognition motif-containing protein